MFLRINNPVESFWIAELGLDRRFAQGTAVVLYGVRDLWRIVVGDDRARRRKLAFTYVRATK
jgi:hypothetical protein